VLTEIPISFLKAALGGEVEIHTLDDNTNGTTTIDLKAGTQPGDHVVRRGQGIPRVGHGGRGDQVIVWRVEIPKKLSARQQELMRELATELGEDVKEKRGLFGRKK
jgi:molecular chaperone DnaJ